MVEKLQDQLATATSERRREPRIRSAKSVLLSIPEEPPIEAWLLDISSKGARLRTPRPIPPATAVRIQALEVLLYGTTVHCHPDRGAYEIGIELSLPLDMLTELRKLNAALVAERKPL
jgi:hypothetical protein